jgi:hypothetical protein
MFDELAILFLESADYFLNQQPTTHSLAPAKICPRRARGIPVSGRRLLLQFDGGASNHTAIVRMIPPPTSFRRNS